MRNERIEKTLRTYKQKGVGEFPCPYQECNHIAFEYTRLMAHIGGAHKKGITLTEQPHCKHCDRKLIPDVKGKRVGNWTLSAQRTRNLICKLCMKKINQKNYLKRKKRLKRK